MKSFLIILISITLTCCHNSAHQVSASKQVTNDTVFDEYLHCDSMPELLTDTIYVGPSGEAMNIAPDNVLIDKYISLTHDSSAPYEYLLLNIDSNGMVTDYKLTALCGNGKIYYDDTTTSSVYRQLGNEFWKLAIEEVKKYPRWKPGYNKGRKVRVLHHMLVVFSKEKVGEEDTPSTPTSVDSIIIDPKQKYLLDSAISIILKLPEVELANKRIDSFTQGKHGIMYIIDNPSKDEPYYGISIGNNGDFRFETFFSFCVYIHKSSFKIRINDPFSESDDGISTIEQWRKNMKKAVK